MIIWLIRLLEDLDLLQQHPITLLIYLKKKIESEKHFNRIKHIDVKYHVIKHLKETSTIKLKYCPSKYIIADIITKPAPKPDFIRNPEKTQTTSISSFEELRGDVEENHSLCNPSKYEKRN